MNNTCSVSKNSRLWMRKKFKAQYPQLRQGSGFTEMGLNIASFAKACRKFNGKSPGLRPSVLRLPILNLQNSDCGM